MRKVKEALGLGEEKNRPRDKNDGLSHLNSSIMPSLNCIFASRIHEFLMLIIRFLFILNYREVITVV